MTLDDRPRVVVTGAGGIVGRAVSEALAADFDVLGIIRSRPAPDGIESLPVDLRDTRATTRAFEGASAVVHLAAAAALDAAWPEVLDDNIEACYSVFEAARIAGVDRVIVASSHHVVGMYEEDGLPGIYDPARRDVIGLDAEVRPDSLYAVSKLFGEALGRFYHERHGMAVICLRIGIVREDDDPTSPAVARSAPWLPLTVPERYARTAAAWLSKRDAAGLVRSALVSDARWAVVYGTSANARLLWDPEPARSVLGFTPRDGSGVHPGTGGRPG